MTSKAVIAIVAVVVIVVVAAGAYVAFSGSDDGSDQTPDVPSVPGGTDPEVPDEPEVPTDPETPVDPEEPDNPDEPETPVDPDQPSTSGQTFVLRTEPRVGDKVTIIVPSGHSFTNPVATITMEVLSIEDGDANILCTSVEAGETYHDSMTVPAEHFAHGYMLLFAVGDGGGEINFEPHGQDTINTLRGEMVCDHYRSDFMEVWYYPGTDFACMMVFAERNFEYYVDSTMLSPA